MKNKKNIVLFALIGIMVVVALVMFLRPKKRRRAIAPTAAAATADGSAVAAPTQADTKLPVAADAALPAHEELKALTDWLVTNDAAELVAACPDRGVFGLAGVRSALHSPAPTDEPLPGAPAQLVAGNSAPETPPPAVPVTVAEPELRPEPEISGGPESPTDALCLDGVICTGRARVALFGTMSCKVGDTVPNTPYRIVEIGANSVALRAEDGRELRLDLLN